MGVPYTTPFPTGTKMATSSLVISDNLKCSICLDLFNDPRLLPCLHIYCLRCLQGLVSDQKSHLNCPQCRAKHEIPKDGVATYLSDLSILPELEAAKVTTRKEETKICGLCTTDVVVSYCKDCSEYLCQSCQDVVHKHGKMFTGHVVVSLEEAASLTPLNFSHVIKQVSYCSHHSDYKLEIFCKTCDILVCSMCMLETTHKGHSYDFFKNVQDELMQRIKSMTASIKGKSKRFKSCITFVEKYEERMHSQQDKVEADINAACDEYIAKVQSMKEELLKQVESKFTEDNKTIWATKDHLELMLSQVDSCQAFSERYQKQGSKGQMLSLTNQLIHRLKELHSVDVDMSTLFNVVTTHTEFKKSSLASFGSLATDNKEVCTKGKLQKSTTTLGKKTNLVYVLNQPLAQLVEWKCKYGRNNNLTSCCHVVVTGDKQLEIQFTPHVPGDYCFQLIPTGTLIKVQEFTISVNCIGARVKRGRDWHYDNEDGGAGNLGTIVCPSKSSEFDFRVKWDVTNKECDYYYGSKGWYDLTLVLQ